MKCSKIISLLGPYVDGECSPEELRMVEEHLRHCPACRSELELLRRIETTRRGTVPPDPGEEYWNTFLPRLRRRIDREQRRPAPLGWGERIRRLFAPPVPWVRLAGAVAAAVLVVVIGRAFIGQKGNLVPMRPLADRPSTDQVRPIAGDNERTPPAANSIAADGEKRALTVPAEESLERMGSGTAGRETPPAEKKAEIPPAEKAPPEREQETDRMMAEDRTDAGLQTPSITAEAARQGNEPVIRAMTPVADGTPRREQIRYWETVIDTSSDPGVLAIAHLELAESWYYLVMADPEPETISAALQAYRGALEYAAEDSLRTLLEQRISRLENRDQKK